MAIVKIQNTHSTIQWRSLRPAAEETQKLGNLWRREIKRKSIMLKSALNLKCLYRSLSTPNFINQSRLLSANASELFTEKLR
jgi:hypothetical protein